MPTFMALLTPQVYVVALHDVPRQTPQKLQDLVDRKVIDKNQLLPLTAITGSKEADIEDMFDASFYLDLLNRAGVATVDPKSLKPGNRILPRVEQALGHKISHYAPARYFAVHSNELLQNLPPATVDRFEKLFKELNDRLTSS